MTMKSTKNRQAVDHHAHRRKALVMGACITLLATALSGCDNRQAVTAEPDPMGGPALVRRLTESQYRATVADIFAPDVPIAARFERGVRAEGLIAVGTSLAGLSPFSIEQYHAAARGVAEEVLSEKRRSQFLPCTITTEKTFDEACARTFVQHYGPLLLRRPLTAEEVDAHIATIRDSTALLGSFSAGLESLLVGFMVSPEFLYRVERIDSGSPASGVAELDPYSKASRLSYFLTNSTPDRELLRAAGAGELDSEEGLAKQVDRLMQSPRFPDTVRAFFADMLVFDHFDDLSKDSTLYPAFNSTVAADAQEQTLRTITHHLLDEQGDYRNLFTTQEAFLTRNLGVVYRVPVPTRSGWEHTEFSEQSQRVGIQSHISFLALHSHPGRSSPTLRGKAIREIFLCQPVPDPPPNVDFTAVDFESTNHSMPTARDRLDRHNREPACAGCHLITDPPALTLENYDGLGAYRTHENGAPINTNGSLDGVEFNSPDGLATALQQHPETPRCLTERLYRYAVGRDTTWEERPYMDWLIARFGESGYKVPQLMRAIALSRNFFTVTRSEAENNALQAGDINQQENRT